MIVLLIFASFSCSLVQIEASVIQSLLHLQLGRSCQSTNNTFLDHYFVRGCSSQYNSGLWCNSQEAISKGEKCLLDEGQSCNTDSQCTNNLVCLKGVCGCDVAKVRSTISFRYDSIKHECVISQQFGAYCDGKIKFT